MESNQVQPQQESEPEDWRDAFLIEIIKKDAGGKEYLFSILRHVANMYESTDPTKAIAKIFEEYVMKTYDNLSSQRTVLRDIMSLVSDLNELRKLYECFDISTDYAETVSDEE